MNVERDYSNLAIAARESFNEGWAFTAAQKTLRLSPTTDREAHLRKVMPKRSLAEGYYAWIEYLLWLAEMHEVVSFRDLAAIEAKGLAIVQRARNEFINEHPACYQCGTRNDRFALFCMSCNEQFKKS